jgi:hypothetical protein
LPRLDHADHRNRHRLLQGGNAAADAVLHAMTRHLMSRPHQLVRRRSGKAAEAPTVCSLFAP